MEPLAWAANRRTESRRGRCVVWWALSINTLRQRNLHALLSDDERQRGQRFHRDRDRARYLTAHALLRLALADALQVDPDRIVLTSICPFCGGPHGKPRLVEPRTELEASLSHSGDRTAAAVSLGTAIGVDVEAPISGEMTRTLASATLSPAEHRTWTMAYPMQEKPAALIAWWTRKEAVLKATGHGLALDPRKIVVAPPGQPPRLMQWPTDYPSAGPIQLYDLSPGAGYAACLATRGPDRLEVVEADGRALLGRYFEHASRRGSS